MMSISSIIRSMIIISIIFIITPGCRRHQKGRADPKVRTLNVPDPAIRRTPPGPHL